MPDGKIIYLDYDYVIAQDTAKKLHALSDQEVQMLLTTTEQNHWLTRWSLEEPTTTEIDIIDAIASGAERGLLEEAPAADDLSPFWDDTDAADADGTPAESAYAYSPDIADWVIAAFIAASGVPGAALTFLTIAPRFRLAFRTRDYGGILEILIDAVSYGTVDTYSATPGLTFFDIAGLT
jgi:hypothetical protein